MYPFFRSEIIPAGVVPRAGRQPVHTLSVDVVLLTRVGSRRRARAPADRGALPDAAAAERRAAVPERNGARACAGHAGAAAPGRGALLSRAGAQRDDLAAACARRRAIHLAGRAHLLRPVRARVVRLSRHRPVAAQRRAACRSPRTRSRGSAHPRAHSRHVTESRRRS